MCNKICYYFCNSSYTQKKKNTSLLTTKGIGCNKSSYSYTWKKIYSYLIFIHISTKIMSEGEYAWRKKKRFDISFIV